MRINKFKNKISILISTMMLLSFGSTSLADSVIDISNLPSGKGVAVGNQLPVNSQSSDGNIVVSNGTKLSVSRIAGKNRYETSYKVGVALGEYKNIVIASGEDFPDALSSGLLGSIMGAPVLLTEKNSVNPYLYSALDSHRNQKYYVVGGESSVSKRVKNDVQTFSKIDLKNLAGKDRYETSVLVASKVNEDIMGNPYLTDMLAVYSGENFADALSATPFMYQNDIDKKNVIPLMVALKNGSKINSELYTFVFGGESFIPKGKEGLRLAGSNRYRTSVEVAKAFKTRLNKDIDTIIIASGETYPDALSSGPLAAKKNAAILLTEARELNKDVKKYIEETKSIKNVIIVGGESSVSSQVEKDLSSIVR